MDISLKSATLYLTDVCNSRCRSCNFWKNSRGSWLSTRKWLDAISQLRQEGIGHISFCGGEPLLRKDLVRLVKEARNTGFSEIEIYTNGLLLTKEVITRMVAAGANKFTLSIDGLKNTHDTFRGIVGSYDKCIRALSHLSHETVTVCVATNLHGELVEGLSELIDVVDSYGAIWVPNILNDRQYYFRGIRKDELAPTALQVPGIIDSIECAISTGKRVGIPEEYLPFIASALAGGTFADMACIVGLSCIYLDAAQKVYSGCNVLPPVGDLTVSSLTDILACERYKRQVRKMLRRQCPGCTCSFYMSVESYLRNGDPIER